MLPQLEIAKKYIGQKEKSGNVFDDTTEFGKLLHQAGQKNGESWCCYAQEVIFCEAFPDREPILRKLFSANCFQTFVNFLQAGFTVSSVPVLGSLVLYQRYKDGILTTQGHAGICSRVVSKIEFEAMEGNTNSFGSREGDSFQYKTGRNTVKLYNGLNVLGFVIIG